MSAEPVTPAAREAVEHLLYGGPVERTEEAAAERGVRFLLDGLGVDSISHLYALVEAGRDSVEPRDGEPSAYAELWMDRAKRQVALRRRIDASGDVELAGLMEERDRLDMDREMALEVRSEWAALARRIAALPEGDPGCACDVCAIGRALRIAASLP